VRMWMVEPKAMCRKHLLGEHVEIHMLAGALRRGRSIAGFVAENLLEPRSARTRHAALAAEMTRRGYRHSSPLPSVPTAAGWVDRQAARRDLATRCPACATRLVSHPQIVRRPSQVISRASTVA